MAREMSDQELDRLLEKEEERIRREKSKKDSKPAAEKPSEKPEAGKPAKEGKEAPEAKAPEKPEPSKPAVPVMGEYNPWGILLYPHLAEKSMNMVEMENKLVFIVSRKANKKDIKEAIEKGFDVKVADVKTEITRKNQKKAYIKLAEGYEAADVASRLGMI